MSGNGGALMGAASGATTGALIGGPWGAAAMGGLGLVQGIMGDNAASAAQDQANAQLDQEKQDRTLAQQYANNPAQLAALQEAITTNQQDISNKQKVLASVDPALIEAGKQALQLEQGKSAASLAPIQNQRAAGRSALQSQLQQQLGSGYATSSAGIQALNNYDQQTSNLMNNAQQSAISTYLGSAQNSANTNSLSNATNALTGISNGYGSMSANAIGALRGTPISSAGAGSVGQLASARAGSAAIGQVSGALGNYYGRTAGQAPGQAPGGTTTVSGYVQPTIGSAYGGSAPNYGLGANTDFGSLGQFGSYP